MRLSQKQIDIYKEVERLFKEKQPIPTVAKLGETFDMTQQAMSKNLKALEAAGMIRRNPYKHRSIELTETLPKVRRIPLLGRIAAGRPLEPLEDVQTVHLPEDFVPNGEVYALEVRGESMKDDGIMNGDTVVVRKTSMAFNGQIVVAVVNGEATLKRYFHEGTRIRLQPANEAMEPYYIGPNTEFEIRGVVHGLFRRYHEARVFD